MILGITPSTDRIAATLRRIGTPRQASRDSRVGMAATLRGTLPDHNIAATRYDTAYRRHVTPRNAQCRWIARLVRRPHVVACAAGLARLSPDTAARIVPFVVGSRLPLESAA